MSLFRFRATPWRRSATDSANPHLSAVRGRPDDALARLAAVQFGVVARRQLLELGLSSRNIARRVERGSLRVVHRGVYAVGHEHLELRGRASAALLWAGEGAVCSHDTAAQLWALMPADDTPCHVSSTRSSSHQPEGIVVHRVRSLPASLTSRRSSLPVTNVPRTILDLCDTHPPHTIRRVIGEALYQRRTSLPQLRDALETSPGRRGVRVLRELLPLAGATHSGVEDRFLPLLATAGIELPQVNVRVAGFQVDCYWPRQKVVVELDTWWSHGDFLTFEADRRRAAALQRAGCVVLRFTDKQLSDELHASLLTLSLTLRERT